MDAERAAPHGCMLATVLRAFADVQWTLTHQALAKQEAIRAASRGRRLASVAIAVARKPRKAPMHAIRRLSPKKRTGKVRHTCALRASPRCFEGKRKRTSGRRCAHPRFPPPPTRLIGSINDLLACKAA